LSANADRHVSDYENTRATRERLRRFRPSSAALVLSAVPLLGLALIGYLSAGGCEDSGTGSCQPWLPRVGLVALALLVLIAVVLMRRTLGSPQPPEDE
jgi:protein-S-isoprenylcysteine O-methyltransferase Ste14